MKITDVRYVQLVRRLERVQRNSCSARQERRFTFVVVETDAGLTGLGDAFGDPVLMPVIRLLGSRKALMPPSYSLRMVRGLTSESLVFE